MKLRESKKKYLQEYEKYKDVTLSLNETYTLKDSDNKLEIVELDEHARVARVKNIDTGALATKTLHWCRKNLIKE